VGDEGISFLPSIAEITDGIRVSTYLAEDSRMLPNKLVRKPTWPGWLLDQLKELVSRCTHKNWFPYPIHDANEIEGSAGVEKKFMPVLTTIWTGFEPVLLNITQFIV
jgi:hypothetical protein